MRVSRKIVIGMAVIAGLLLVSLAALPLLIDANRFRPLLQTQLETRLHRQVSLGDMQLKMFPPSVRVSGFSIGQPEGFHAAQPFLRADEVYIGVALWPLLHKEVNIDAIRLRAPSFGIIRNPEGVWNYETAREEPAQGRASSTVISLDELRVEDGQVAVQDQKNGTSDVYKHIDLTLRNLGPNRRGSLEGSVRLETIAAALSAHCDFENRDVFTAKGTLNFKSDRSRDALDVVYDLRRAPPPAPLIVNLITAKIGVLTASAVGSVDIDRTPASLQFHVQIAKAPIADLLRIAAIYGATFPAGLKADGLLAADLQVAGTIERPAFAGSIDATKAQISAKDLPEPVRASALHIDFTPDSLTARPFTLETGVTRLTVQGTVRGYNSQSPQVDATIETNGARVEELLRMASVYGVKPKGLAGSGAVTVNVKISQTAKAVNYSGSGSLRDVSLTSPQLPKALTVSNASVKFSEDRLAFEHLQAALGSMHLDGSGSVRDFPRPNIQFDLHVDQLNAAELRDWGSGGIPRKSGTRQSTILDKLTANGVAVIDKVLYDRIVLDQVRTSVSFANGVLRLDPLAAFLFGGQQSGSVVVDLCGDSPAYAVKAKLNNVDVNQLLSATTSVRQVLSGNFAGNADVRFLGSPNDEIVKSLNGKVQFHMGQGRLAGVQILNQVASIGGLLGYSRTPDSFTNISKLTGSFNIQNGVASTTDLFMDMQGATLSGAGTVGLADQSLKLRVTTVLSKEFLRQNAPGQIGGMLTTALVNQKGELIVPAIVTGTFAQPKFAPDVEQIAQLKLRGLLPTADNPAAFTSGVKGIVEAITGKQPAAKPSEAKPVEAKPAQPQPGSILDLFKQLGKKKDEKKQ